MILLLFFILMVENKGFPFPNRLVIYNYGNSLRLLLDLKGFLCDKWEFLCH